jgi:hypothetical protein
MISLINPTFAPHVYSLTVYFIADTISVSPQCSVSNTISRSLHCLALFPSPSIWYKIPGNHFHVIIDHNKLFWYTSLFHLEVAHNKPIMLSVVMLADIMPSVVMPSVVVLVKQHLSWFFFRSRLTDPSRLISTDRKKKVSSRNRDEEVKTFEEILFRSRQLSISNVESL